MKLVEEYTLTNMSYRVLASVQTDVFPGWGGTPYNGLYGEAPLKRGTFFTFQVYKRVGISQVDVYNGVEKSVIQVFKRAFNYNISNRHPLWLNHFIY